MTKNSATQFNPRIIRHSEFWRAQIKHYWMKYIVQYKKIYVEEYDYIYAYEAIARVELWALFLAKYWLSPLSKQRDTFYSWSPWLVGADMVIIGPTEKPSTHPPPHTLWSSRGEKSMSSIGYRWSLAVYGYKGPQVKCIYIKGLKIPPLEPNYKRKYGCWKSAFSASPFRIRPQENYASSFLGKFKRMLTTKIYPLPSHTPQKNLYITHF